MPQGLASRPRIAWRELLWFALLACLFVGAFTTRIVPEPLYDRSIYQSVAERLLAGDRLYVDVVDNKDPLFYFAVTGQRLLGPFAEYAFELACVLGSALLAAGLARRLHPGSKTGQRLVLIGTALMLTGLHYDLGGTIPPGLTLTLLAISLAAAGRDVACGLALGALLFAKLIYLPIALAFLLAQEWASHSAPPRALRRLTRCGLALAATTLAIVLILLWRGELGGYLDTQKANLFYSSSNVFTARSLVENLRDHALTALYFGRPILLVALCVFLFLVGELRRSRADPALHAYLVAVVLLFPVTLAIVAFTAIWGAHLAVLHIFLALAAAHAVPALLERHRARIAAPILLAGCGILAGLGSDRALLANPLEFAARLRGLTAPSEEAEALRRVAGPGPVRYARLGSDNDFHHAAGTRGDKLACPQFFQYRFTDPRQLHAIITCAAQADYLIVDFPEDEPLVPGTFVTPVADFAGLNRRWANYVAAAEAMVRQHFRCVQQGETLRICQRLSRARPSLS